MSSPHSEPLQDKAVLRRDLKARRSAISTEDRESATRRALEALMAWPPWQAARTIALYRATADELDPAYLAASAFQAGQRLVYPRTQPMGVMHFHDPGHPPAFEPGPGRIDQPLGHSPRIEPGQIDLVVVPLLGCDDSGVRLGYGGGYYDRFLPLTKARTVGIGFSTQRVARLPAEDHDVRLDWFVDERGVQRLG